MFVKILRGVAIMSFLKKFLKERKEKQQSTTIQKNGELPIVEKKVLADGYMIIIISDVPLSKGQREKLFDFILNELKMRFLDNSEDIENTIYSHIVMQPEIIGKIVFIREIKNGIEVRV